MFGTIKGAVDTVIGDARLYVHGKADRIAGSGEQIKGSIKLAVGKVFGDAGPQAYSQAEGKIQYIFGTIKDSLK